MSEKVKVSRKVADAIETFKNMHKEKFNITNLDELLDIATDWWIRGGFHECGDLHTVHDLKFIDFCNAFYYGYEVEQTPEEILLQEYQECLRIGAGHRTHANAIKSTLDTLGIKIKGINE